MTGPWAQRTAPAKDAIKTIPEDFLLTPSEARDALVSIGRDVLITLYNQSPGFKDLFDSMAVVASRQSGLRYMDPVVSLFVELVARDKDFYTVTNYDSANMEYWYPKITNLPVRTDPPSFEEALEVLGRAQAIIDEERKDGIIAPDDIDMVHNALGTFVRGQSSGVSL